MNYQTFISQVKMNLKRNVDASNTKPRKKVIQFLSEIFLQEVSQIVFSRKKFVRIICFIFGVKFYGKR